MTEGWPDDMTLWDQLFGLISIQFHRSTVPHVRIRILFFLLLLFHFELDEKIVYIFYYISDLVGDVHLLGDDLLILAS